MHRDSLPRGSRRRNRPFGLFLQNPPPYLPVPTREEAQEGQNQDDDEDDPEKAHAHPVPCHDRVQTRFQTRRSRLSAARAREDGTALLTPRRTVPSLP